MNHEAVLSQKLVEGIERSLELLQRSDEEFKRKREEARKWLKCNSATKRTPECIADLNRRGGIADSYIILSGHAFWKEYQLRDGLHSLFHFADQACRDMCLHENAIAAYKGNPEGSPKEFDAAHPALLAQKDFLTYCASAVGFEETLKGIRGIRCADAPDLKRISNDCFKSEIGVLIKLLRNGFVHARVPSPVWSTTAKASNGGKEARRASLFLFQNELESLRDRHLEERQAKKSWETAFAYFDRVCEHDDLLGPTMSLTYLVAQHFQQLNACYDSVLTLFGADVSDCEQDFQSLLDSASSLYAA